MVCSRYIFLIFVVRDQCVNQPVSRTGIDPKRVQDIQVGNVLAPGGFAIQARMSAFLAGFPDTTAVATTNRQCSSGLQSIANIAAAIKAGHIDIGIGAGVESMSQHKMGASSLGEVNEDIFDHPGARDCLVPMGMTSENVAEKFSVSRDKQDKMALESHNKALAAQQRQDFASEIVPVKTKVVGADEEEKEIVVTQDDGPRKSTLAGLQKLRPAFKKDGTTTAGNSSQVSDGAAAVLVARRSAAKSLGLPIVGTFREFAAVGVPPAIMGVGPAAAIPAVLGKAGLKTQDISVYEINEAFASQAVFCVEKLGIDMGKVNPRGGAIALGHPLGCTGSRQVATLLPQLKSGDLGVVSMCIGTGLFEPSPPESCQFFFILACFFSRNGCCCDHRARVNRPAEPPSLFSGIS